MSRHTLPPTYFIVDTTHLAFPVLLAEGDSLLKAQRGANHAISAFFNHDQSRAIVKVIEPDDAWRRVIAVGNLILQVITTREDHVAWLVANQGTAEWPNL